MVDASRLARAQCLLRSSFAEQTAELVRYGIRYRVAIASLKAVQHEFVDAQDARGRIDGSGTAGHR
jgi:hypothetical protein